VRRGGLCVQTYGIKATCCWEHPLGTYQEPIGNLREHVGNKGKMNKILPAPPPKTSKKTNEGTWSAC